ncbi:MAG TPA: hypothetical protein VE621_14415 [Bryobacteraceae bacterium]|nr:hypothetical protein [Bryobacteraceae bacterium]
MVTRTKLKRLRLEYERRLQYRSKALEQHEKQSQTLGNIRLVTVLLGAVVAWWNVSLVPIPVAIFVILVVWHERVAAAAAREKRAIAWYERALARLDGNWAGKGSTGDQFRSPDHPYAEDLDLFGKGSVFELISMARTVAGEEVLASWLMTTTASVEEVRERQEAVRELQPHLDFRETLVLLGEDIRAEVHPEALIRWTSLPPVRFFTGARWVSTASVLVSLLTLTGFFGQFWTWHVPVAWLLVQGVYGFLLRDKVLQVLHAVDLPAHDLRLIGDLLAKVENNKFESPRLRSLQARIQTQGRKASQEIAHLRSLVERDDWAHNEFFKPVARILLWSTHLAIAIEDWRQRSGPAVASWLEAIGEVEALCSLASYASENPEDVWPDLVPEGPLFDAEGLAHPLLPSNRAVRNDLRLDSSLRLMLVSGSNMSGKSTLLRSVGLGAVLAWAGAPVRATRLQISPLVVGAEMRVQDSVQEGRSRFYAEILRLRQIVNLSDGPVPLLYLLDEVLAGTNSHDRRIGAQAILISLVSRGAIGLVTTHDLALASIVDALGEVARNVHFEDHIEDGRIVFDYRMRPGIVTKSNAIELMRSIGLEV